MGKKGEAVTILVVVGLLALGAYTLLTVSSESPTGLTGFQTGAITACGNVAASDNLTQDISSGTSCLNITADNVIIDCQGYTINFNGGSGIGDIGIHAQSKNNITIRNCNINDTGTGGTTVYGLAFDNVSNSVIENSNFSIRGGAADHAAIRVNGDYTFASLSGANNNIIRNNIIFSNGSFAGEGIVVYNNVSNNLIEKNNITLVNVSNLGTCCDNAIEVSGGGSNNTVRNNTINATIARGMTINSVNDTVVEYNQINVSAQSGFSALVISGDNSSEIRNNYILTTGSGYGVDVSTSTSTIFEYNNITTNAANNAYGIQASGTNTGTFIRNNIVSTYGTLGGNTGIYFSSSATGLIIFNNTINPSGTSGSNYGIYVTGSANNISQNTIRTNSTGGSTGSNHGIQLSNGDSNNVHDNFISTFGNGGGSNEGIKLSGGSDSNNVTRNNITTSTSGASGGDIGIDLEFLADSNIISYNIINTTGGGTNNHGIRLYARNVTSGGGGGGGASIEGFETESPNPATCNGGNPCESVSNNWIYRNVIRSNGTDISHGIFLISENLEMGGGGGASIEGFGTESALNSLNSSVTGNLIQENTILSATHTGSSPSNGIQLSGINSANSAVNNSFVDNNVSNTTGAGVMLALASSGTTFNGTRIINPAVWLNASASTSHNFTNTAFATDFGVIRIIGNFTFNGLDSVLRDNLNVTSNSAFVNSTAKSFLNQSSHITFTGLTGARHDPTVDFNDDGIFETCNATQCTNIVYSGGTLDFDVASFTTYSSLNVAGLSINLSKSDSQDPVNNGSQLNYTIIFNVTNGTAVNISIVEVYPANVSFVSASPSPNVSNNTWQPADLTNSSFTINVTVLVNSNAANGSILNNTITTSFNNLSGGNLSLNVSELTTVNATAAPANLTPTTVAVAKTDSPDPVNNGSQLNYTINVTVTEGNATNVTVVDTFPSSVTFVSASPANTSNGTWSLGNLTNGTTVLINITVNVSASASGTLVNSVNVTFQNASNNTNSVSASASTTVNTGGGSSGSSGGGGSGGSGGTICPPLCQYPENANLPVCRNNCPQPTEMVAPPVQELPAFPAVSDSVDTSANLPESESAVPLEEDSVEVVEESVSDQRGLASFFPWLILLILIALVIAILSHGKKGGSKPAPIAIKTSVTKQTTKAHSKETEEILNNIRKSEERLKHLLGK